MVPRFMNPLARAKTVSLLRAGIAVALCALAMIPRVESQEDSKYTLFAIAYFGALDNPISQIVISDSYGGAEWYRNSMMKKDPWDEWHLAYLHVLSRPFLGRLIATVESQKGGVQPEPGKQYIYNGVSMTIVTPQRQETFLFHVEPAMSLLDQLGNVCKDDESLHSDLLYFQKRVRPWGDMSAPRRGPQDRTRPLDKSR
jgi:hypothetical protein